MSLSLKCAAEQVALGSVQMTVPCFALASRRGLKSNRFAVVAQRWRSQGQSFGPSALKSSSEENPGLHLSSCDS